MKDAKCVNSVLTLFWDFRIDIPFFGHCLINGLRGPTSKKSCHIQKDKSWQTRHWPIDSSPCIPSLQKILFYEAYPMGSTHWAINSDTCSPICWIYAVYQVGHQSPWIGNRSLSVLHVIFDFISFLYSTCDFAEENRTVEIQCQYNTTKPTKYNFAR